MSTNALDYPKPVTDLIARLKRLPGIGPRSAERIALWLVQSPDAAPQELAGALTAVATSVEVCQECGFFLDARRCANCESPRQASGIVCVVEQPTDVLPIERSGAYGGSYHVLGGRLAPLDGIGPEDLRIKRLLERVRAGEYTEVLLALGGDVEGEATASYLAGLLGPYDVRVTRIAQGLPVGSDLGHADSLTIGRAIEHRFALGAQPAQA